MKYLVVVFFILLIGTSMKVNGSGKKLRKLSDTTDTTNFPKVILTFVVEKDGTVSNVKGKIARCVGCTKKEMRAHIDSAVSVLKRSPPWNVGMQNGKLVRVAYTLPVVINLNDSTSNSK